MENCLVTKLKGVVQNDNLPKLGELKIIVHHRDSEPSNRYIGIGAPSGSAGSKARVVGDGAYFYTGHGQSEVNVGTEVNDFRQWTYGVSNPPEGQTYTIYLENKYNIHTVYDNWYNLEFDDLSFIKYLTENNLNAVSLTNNYKSYDINDICGNLSIPSLTFTSSLLTGDINDLNYSETRSLSISGSRFVLDTNLLYDFPKLTSLFVGSINTSSVIDASRLPDTVNSFGAPTATWKTVRTGSFISMGSSNPVVNFGDDVDAMLKNQANLTRTDGSAVTYLNVRGNTSYDTDPAVQAAVDDIRRKNVNVYINGTLYPAINS